MQKFQEPELRRIALDEVCLHAKLANESEATANFLAAAIDPPEPRAVDRALALLTAMGALDEDEQLTRLGRHLAELPLSPHLGLLILYGLLFDCIDPFLTLAASMESPCALGHLQEAV